MPDAFYCRMDSLSERGLVLQLSVTGDTYDNSGWNVAVESTVARF